MLATGSPSAATAFASPIVNVAAVPLAPGPRFCGEPGMIVSRFDPSLRTCPVIASLAPLPTASSVTTDATPMMTPSIVSRARTRFAARRSSEIRTSSTSPAPLDRAWSSGGSPASVGLAATPLLVETGRCIACSIGRLTPPASGAR